MLAMYKTYDYRHVISTIKSGGFTVTVNPPEKFFYILSYFAAWGCTLMNLRPSLPVVNTTTPSIRAKRV